MGRKITSLRAAMHNSTYLIPSHIETPRLLLRPFRDGDWRDLHAYYGDLECTRYTFQRALSEGETWRAMASMVGHWQLRGYGPYALEEKESGKVLGTAGLWYPQEWPEPEIKWALSRRYWGQGYAAEAARAVQAMAAEHVPQLSLISLIHADNAASIQLAEAVGAHRERGIPFRGSTYLVFRHPQMAA